MQMPQPTQSSSDITGLPLSPMTIVSSPVRTRGQKLMHSWLHLLGWHLSLFSTAMRMGAGKEHVA